MKKQLLKKLYAFIITAIIISVSASAQTPLPYYWGFDASWQEFRKGVTASYGWLGSDVNPHSAPGNLYHENDFSAASTDTTIDWFVSPQFDFSGGAIIDSVFAEIGNLFLTPVDFIGLYLLNGSPDPSFATTATLLKDFTSFPNGPGGGWGITTNIIIPSTAGASFIAFKYIGTNTNFIVEFDDLYISANTTGIENVNTNAEINLYPNPANNHLTIALGRNNKKVDVTIADITGKIIYSTTASDTQKIEVNTHDFAEGIYIVQIQTVGFTGTKKIIITK